MAGGGGYIGSVLVNKLLDCGFNVTVIDRFFFGEEILRFNHHANVSLVRQDIRFLSEADLSDFYAVYDLAAISNDPSGDIDPKITKSINIDGRLNLAKCAKLAGVERYLFFSSCSVYGKSQSEFSLLDEESDTNPLTVYAESMLEGESLVIDLASPDFCVTVLRLGTVFGVSDRMRFDLAVNLMTWSALVNREIIIMGGGNQCRPFVSVKDVADIACSVMQYDEKSVICGQKFNVVHQNYSVFDLAREIADCFPGVQLKNADDQIDERDYRVSSLKLDRELSLRPLTTIKQGAIEISNDLKLGVISFSRKSVTVRWYRELLNNPDVYSHLKKDGILLI